MKTAVINVKVDEMIKKSAQKLAKELGLNLSVIINGSLKSFVVNKRITFDINSSEEPSDYLVQAIKEAEDDKECSPIFEDANRAISWLRDKNRKYESGVQKKLRKKTR